LGQEVIDFFINDSFLFVKIVIATATGEPTRSKQLLAAAFIVVVNLSRVIALLEEMLEHRSSPLPLLLVKPDLLVICIDVSLDGLPSLLIELLVSVRECFDVDLPE